MPILEHLIAVIAPHTCVGCGAEGHVVCYVCRQELPNPISRCYRCHASDASGKTCVSCRSTTSLRRVSLVTRYEGLAKIIIWRLKFNHVQAAAAEIAMLMSIRFGDELKTSNLLIVPVPTATRRVRQRGYDQATLIARYLAGQLELPYASLLRRYGQQQQHGATRALRLKQLKEAFEVRADNRVQGSHILLVDDVLTTGATFEAAAETLKMAGAKTVDVIAFAQA